MDEERLPKLVKWVPTAIIVVMILLTGLLIIPIFPVFCDRAYICENTGSYKGYREWFWGSESHHWYKRSKLEAFMAERYPLELQYRWTSYAGTSKNIFGYAMMRGHGHPGPIIRLRFEWLDTYLGQLNDNAKKALYDVFKSEEENRIEEEINKVYHFLLKQH